MSALEMLAKKVSSPDFAKAYRRDKVKAIEETIGRPLASHEREGVRALSHAKLIKVVKALRPRKAGAHPPE
jgi:hypothetical protein